MRTMLIGLVIIALVGAGIYYAVATLGKASEEIETIARPESEPSRHWGAVVRPFALDLPGQPTTWQRGLPEQLDLIKELGGSVVRSNIEVNQSVMDALVDQATAQDLYVLLILEVADDNPVLEDSIATNQLYDLGLKLGREKASRYRGKVRYYQLANEVTGTAAHRPEDTGSTLPNRYDLQFDKNRVERVIEYTKGLADGVKQGDPEALRMVTGHWVLVDMIKYLIDGGADFEIVGWDWYSDMGIDPGSVKIDGQANLDLPGTMTAWGKDFWLAEVNKESGSFEGTAEEQAEYLRAVAEVVAADERIDGMVVHMLPDMAAEQGTETGELGLVRVGQDTNGAWQFASPKPAYLELQKIFLAEDTQPSVDQDVRQ